MAIAKKVTINDVAHAAGVSVATVSLVLSGKGRISTATGERVSQAIEHLGFVRNRQAASLRGGQTGVIGLIVGDLSSPFYAELAAGLIEALESQGKMVFLTQGGKQGEHMLQRFATLVSQGVDGVVIAGSVDQGMELRDKADESGVPLVFASRASYLDDVDLIRPDNMQAAQMITEHLIRRGHQRIAWLGGLSASLTRAERVGGYCATLLKFGLPFHSEWVVECETSQKQASQALTQLLRHNPTITAVVCYNNVVAMGAWLGLMRAGWQSGEHAVDYYDKRVALAAFADVPEKDLDDAPMSWVITPAREMGKSVAERMLQRIEDRKSTARNQIMPPRLVKQQ
ncbi:Mal regulon transcriptional regulator MalI [Scandinavium manionii]|uniref:Mal regulon transcriptional regulator MalI n=1 Tax=Scandinavium manionii TaxID=2926520 RepID=UPI001358E654|nr:Mal regulon transcriptional regulator MalI [Scandinavium manionii]MCS2147381.1 Mal regulon transcriptional regulator MalI [Scandinavium manionii]MCS2167687.1 Mal regulon transcriptional regulator MalI [Scandinavium manionii]